MIGNAARRARLMRLRIIENRMAAARMAQANAALSQLMQVTHRIGALKHALCPAPGNTNGLSMKSDAELAQRLDLASASMTAPIQDAQEHCMISHALQVKAQQREDSSVKLHDRAIEFENQARTLRTDANRPFRKRAAMLGEIA
jgi:hypothetical protein